jgi:multisubunit Na+/H+ antiporter MnhG subunit
MMLRKIVDIFCIITFVLLIFGLLGVTRMTIRFDESKHIDKSKCVGLPSSDVNDYWACKKEVKK